MQRLLSSLLIALAAVLGVFAFATTGEAGGGGHGGCPEKPTQGPGDRVTIERSCFTSTILFVKPGVAVTWINRDEAQHNATFLDGTVAGGDQFLLQGESASQTFDESGLFAYYCSIHPWMVGAVAVGEPASFALTKPAEMPAPEAPAAATSGRGSMSLTAGLLLAVGLVSAGGGYLLRRRRA